MDWFVGDFTSYITLISCLLTVYCIYKWRQYQGNPLYSLPGPGFSLPIFGHIHLLRGKPHLALSNLQEKYGDVFKLQLGPHTAVVVAGKDTIKEFCSLATVAGRPHRFFNSWTKHERYFAFGHSKACLKYRKVAVKSISSLSSSKVAEVCQEAVEDMVENFCKTEDGSLQIEQARSSVADISYYLCFGEKKKLRNDSEFQKVIDSLKNVLSFASVAGIADLFPWVLYLPSFRQRYSKFSQAQDDLVQLVKNQELRHHKLDRQTLNGKEFEDLCDLLKRSISEDEVKKLMEEDQNIGTPSEQTGMLLFAGYETVAVSLSWAILLLAEHTNAQERIYDSLSTGSSELLEAFILETLRFSMASPLSMPHMTTESCTVNGYLIPAETLVLVNLWSGSRDSKIWGPDADTFQPFRFLSGSDSNQIDTAMTDQLIAFGSGRRRCVGEQLAKNELRLLLSGLITRCSISLVNKNEAVDYWPQSQGSRNVPPTVDLKFKRRD